jgi:hypothetical protein
MGDLHQSHGPIPSRSALHGDRRSSRVLAAVSPAGLHLYVSAPQRRHFFLAFLLSKSPIGLGSAFGLFAVFGILRYRTEGIQVRNLTYLFVVIGVALLNALANDQISLVELVTVNAIIVGSVCILEASSFSGREESRQVLYDRLDLLGPATQPQLLEDLRARTRLPVERYVIGDVDLLRDSACITVYYPVSRRRDAVAAQHPVTRDVPRTNEISRVG